MRKQPGAMSRDPPSHMQYHALHSCRVDYLHGVQLLSISLAHPHNSVPMGVCYPTNQTQGLRLQFCMLSKVYPLNLQRVLSPVDAVIVLAAIAEVPTTVLPCLKLQNGSCQKRPCHRPATIAQPTPGCRASQYCRSWAPEASTVHPLISGSHLAYHHLRPT